MKRTLKTEALVLKKRSLPNQDKIITLFAEDMGKLTVFAKGIKKITSRRLPHAQTANLISVVLYNRNGRYYLQETALISGFSRIKNDPVKVGYLYVFIFVADRLLPEEQSEKEVYVLSKKYIIELSHAKQANPDLLTRYLNQLLVILGYAKQDMSFDQLQATIEEIIHEKIPDLHL